MKKSIPLYQLLCVHAFRKAYIQLRREAGSQITRAQVYFLCLLFAYGTTDKIRAKNLVPLGFDYNSGRQFLYKLKRAGFATKQGTEWTINDKGIDYYKRFAEAFTELVNHHNDHRYIF